MANSYRIGTLNVQGLNNKSKRITVLGYLRKHRIDTTCLQETYIKSDNICEIEEECKGKVLYKQGTDRSKGLIILIGPKLSETPPPQKKKTKQNKNKQTNT